MGALTATLVAMLMDAALGEPAALWRKIPAPRVLILRLAQSLRARLEAADKIRLSPRLKGALAILALAAGAIMIGALIRLLPFSWIIECLIGAALIGFADLLTRLRGLRHGMERGPDAAQSALARLARREVPSAEVPALGRYGLELAARQFVDRFLTPVFWGALFGLPGLVCAVVADCARAVFAATPEEEEGFGAAAAALDHVLKWVPARLAGWVFVAVGGRDAYEALVEDAALHHEDAAGPPVAALAGGLDLSLYGPPLETPDATRPYINRAGRRDVRATDLETARGYLWRAWAICAALLLALALLAQVF